MKFLVDAQLPPALCRWLRERGYETTHVADVGLVAADDAVIADRAEADGVVLVSKDEDFVTLRLDPEVIDRFREGGPGWQGRINKVPRKAVGLR
jgi:predicted nuclease of predicted toxin-antitoxin system